MKQIPLAIDAPIEPSFENFLAIGPALPALGQLRALAPGSTPVYLWGPRGSGKTHLLRALAASRRCLGEGVGWFDPDTAVPWALDERRALIVIDECERLNAAQQQAAFALFVEATTEGLAWAAAGRWPPVDLPLREDLRTRLAWGHVFALEPLPEAQARAALRREAERRGVHLSDEVMDYLLSRFARDLKHLMGLLGQLDRFALANKRALTVPLLKQMLAQEQDGAR